MTKSSARARKVRNLSVLDHSAVAYKPLAAIKTKVTLRNKTQHFNIYYFTSLGGVGQTIADGVLTTCESDYNRIAGYFGGITPPGLPFNIYLAPLSANGDGRGGAGHPACLSGEIGVDVKTNPTLDIDLSRFLVVAEVVEVFSAAQNLGWNCGADNGEGLSRVLATVLYPAELDGYATAGFWLDLRKRPDYVDKNKATDRDRVANGCSVLFLNFLNSQLKFGWNQIVAAGAPTLAKTYAKLTGQSNGFVRFKNLLQSKFPQGKPSRLQTDNPFPL